MEPTGELAWFRAEVLRSIVHPRSFARSLAEEHFSLAGVLVVVGAGIALSLTIDLLVLAAKGISPGPFVARLIFESLLLGARLAVSVAFVAFVVFLGTRLTRQKELTLDQCEIEIDALRDAWNGYLHEAVFDTVIDYTNSIGEKWSNRVLDILTHVVIHGAYHRGQIAIIVRDGGDAPAYTDYIHCLRNGFI